MATRYTHIHSKEQCKQNASFLGIAKNEVHDGQRKDNKISLCTRCYRPGTNFIFTVLELSIIKSRYFQSNDKYCHETSLRYDLPIKNFQFKD